MPGDELHMAKTPAIRSRRVSQKLGPLFMTCKRHGCEGIRKVRNRWEQRTAKYCTRRCAALVATNLNTVDPRESGRKGGLVTGVKRRAATFEKVKLLTPMQAYRKGRMEGWHAGHRNAMARIALDAS